MDDAKYPAFDTKPYRIVKSRSEASVPVNVAPTYYIVASDLQGFPLQQAIPLVQMSTNAQLAPRPPENQLPPLPVPRPGTPMRWYIASLLRCLGVPARLSGFNYLVETLLLLVNRPFETRLVTGEVYPVVAKQCNTTPIGVDQAIRTAVNQTWQEQNIPVYCALMGRKFFKSLTKIVVLTTLSRLLPAASRIAVTLRSECRVCSAISPVESCPVAISMGRQPDTNTKLPTLMP